MIVSP